MKKIHIDMHVVISVLFVNSLLLILAGCCLAPFASNSPVLCKYYSLDPCDKVEYVKRYYTEGRLSDSDALYMLSNLRELTGIRARVVYYSTSPIYESLDSLDADVVAWKNALGCQN